MNSAAIRALLKIDPSFRAVARQVGPTILPDKPRASVFEALVTSIVYQQLHGKAAATILGRVKALFPRKRFPTPQDLLRVSPAKLRAAGLSGAKTAAIKDIARHAQAKKIPSRRATERLSNEELVAQLTQIRGVGPWTVEMLLIFTLRRPDVLPVTDFGVRRGFQLHLGLREMPHPKELAKHGERWMPVRTTAALHLWQIANLASKRKPAGRSSVARATNARTRRARR
jgi:DNA-3-methyladenine glycosylase II